MTMMARIAMMVEVMLPAVSAPSPWVLGTASGIIFFFPVVFSVVEEVSPPSSIVAVVEDPLIAVVVTAGFTVVVTIVVDDGIDDDVVVGVITVTFIWAQTLRPLPLLPPHTYSSISHLQ